MQKAEAGVAMVVRVLMAMAAVAAMPLLESLAARFRLPFLERKFLAHADTQFAHQVSLVVRDQFDRTETIIIKSSNIKQYHQIIIITF
jgi:hypothetical protein